MKFCLTHEKRGGYRDSRERDRENDYKPRRGRQNSNEGGGYSQERRSNRGGYGNKFLEVFNLIKHREDSINRGL